MREVWKEILDELGYTNFVLSIFSIAIFILVLWFLLHVSQQSFVPVELDIPQLEINETNFTL